MVAHAQSDACKKAVGAYDIVAGYPYGVGRLAAARR
jgi:hypothetical protein